MAWKVATRITQLLTFILIKLHKRNMRDRHQVAMESTIGFDGTIFERIEHLFCGGELQRILRFLHLLISAYKSAFLNRFAPLSFEVDFIRKA